jgi:cell division protein FtsB
VAVLLLVFWPAASATAQSGSATPPAQLSTPPQSQTQTQSQPVSQSETAAQTDSGDKPQSLADAARKANAQKDKPKAKRVFTEDDLSSVRGTISVVGDGTAGRGSEQNWNSNAAHQGNNGASSAGKDEAYWRGRARAIKDQIADVDRQISDKKDEIAKSGPNGFDPSTGLSQNVIVVHDRNAELKQLEDRKQSLERQLDDLADEGRKAGADSGWFR